MNLNVTQENLYLFLPSINEGDDYLNFKDNMEVEERHFIEKITNKI